MLIIQSSTAHGSVSMRDVASVNLLETGVKGKFLATLGLPRIAGAKSKKRLGY
jgi:hypothetical protein